MFSKPKTNRQKLFEMYVGKPVKENLLTGSYGHVIGFAPPYDGEDIPRVKIKTANGEIEVVPVEHLQTY